MRFLFVFVAMCACGGEIQDVDGGTDAASSVDAKSKVDASVMKDAHVASCDFEQTNYSNACNVASDCASVFLGNACTAGCLCANGVIATSSLAQYQADFDAVVDGGGAVCPCPPGLPPSCCSGACVAGPCN